MVSLTNFQFFCYFHIRITELRCVANSSTTLVLTHFSTNIKLKNFLSKSERERLETRGAECKLGVRNARVYGVGGITFGRTKFLEEQETKSGCKSDFEE